MTNPKTVAVPVEPTPEMIDAALRLHPKFPRSAMHVAIEDAIAAVPTPPAEHIETVMELEHEGRRFTVPGWIGPHIAELLAKGEKAAAPKQQAVEVTEEMVEEAHAAYGNACLLGAPSTRVAMKCALQAALSARAQQGRGVAIEGAVNERGEPDLIWLQVHGEADPADYNRPPDIQADYVSWYWERLFDHDVMYVRADLAAPKQQAVDKETLVAFERVFWKAVELSGSRDFDHDVCKEVRDFRSLLAALPGKTEVDRG